MNQTFIGLGIIALAIAVMTLLATLKVRGPATHGLVVILMTIALRLFAWTFSWWIVVVVALIVVIMVLIWALFRPPNDPPNQGRAKLYLYGPTTGGIARRIRFDDETD